MIEQIVYDHEAWAMASKMTPILHTLHKEANDCSRLEIIPPNVSYETNDVSV